jgi:hypothetical protein
LRYPQKEIHASYLAISRHRSEEFAAALEFLDNILDRDMKKIVMPILDTSGPVTARGLSLFGVETRDAESAVRDLIRSGDPWLVACAVATAAEQKLRKLTPDIEHAAQTGGSEVTQVARAAAVALG